MQITEPQCTAGGFSQFDPPSIGGGHLGWSVDVRDGKALVGAPFVSGGYAYLYDIETGSELLRLRGADVSANDLFGQSVKLTDQFALVSASQGRAVYLFDTQSGQQIRRFSDPAATAGFGWYVDMNDDLVIVGDHGNSARGSDAGAVFLFDRHTGNRLDLLLPDSFSILDHFGLGLELDGDRLVVGAPGASGNSSSDGAVYVYDVNTRTKLRTLTADDTSGFADFGRGISVDGEFALIGAPMLGGQGAAYLFNIETGEQIRKFSSPSPPGGNFGFRVNLKGNLALIGDPFHSVEGRGTAVGSAYLYDVTTGDLLRTFLPDDVGPQDNFGWEVDFENQVFVFGAPGSDGRVYYTVIPEPSSVSLFLACATLSTVLFRCRGLRNDGNCMASVFAVQSTAPQHQKK